MKNSQIVAITILCTASVCFGAFGMYQSYNTKKLSDEDLEYSFEEDFEEDSEEQEQITEVKPVQVKKNTQATSEKGSPSFEMYGITFNLPDGWTGKAYSATEGVLFVPDSRYEVKIPVNVVKGVKPEGGKIILEDYNRFVITKIPCGGGLGCYGVEKMQDARFKVTFGKMITNETPPANLDGIWEPSTKVKQSTLDQIMLTIQ